jgi:hypothetical protein
MRVSLEQVFLLTKEKKHHQIGKTNNILKKNMEGESQVP